MTASKRDVIKTQRIKKKRQQRMNTILWVGGFILLIVILFASPSIYNALKPAGEFIRITPEARPLADGKGIGDPNAPVKIEVYEDFQCPACKEYTGSVEKQLIDSTYISSGQVYYEYMQYPFLDSNVVTKESQQAANASMCALEQGRFWDYHDLLYVNQGVIENGGSYNDTRLRAFAESLGLDTNAFNNCFNDNKYRDEIESELQRGKDLGVTGTPTVIVNGTIITPKFVPTYEQIQATIEAELAKIGG
jgi:protein-disulfide isomerase